ncbi:penicillin acylase family protein [Marinobacter sp. M216]|uniref:Penicillin acylase family protein n=1 Tax=Marinobacter albus TaxID=3030833 RepID=A0ABT7HF85_9GAMM|nr:penicillin acylase family protein [Marinobacter sp. M216]MDK9559034.1 penicillin acylase family protein [Marinobacter sp. M216]
MNRAATKDEGAASFKSSCEFLFRYFLVELVGSASFISVAGNGESVVNKYKDDTMKLRYKGHGQFGLRRTVGLAVLLAGSAVLTGCFHDDDDDSSSVEASLDTNLFPADGKLEATIRRTTGGVPHVTADNLKSAAFGHGYAQTQDNICVLAEAIVKARSERAKYFGPGPDTQIGVGLNIINDFSYKAQKIYSGAEAEYAELSDESRALVDGFTEGYNRYVNETDPADLPAECAGQEWVKPITPVDLLAHYRIVGQYASGALFATGAVFLAVPPGESPAPSPVSSVTDAEEVEALLKNVVATAQTGAKSNTNFSDMGLASNAWGIGKTMTEQGRGALLANPHFPYTGHRRLYEVQMTVPGYLNVHGAGLLGTAIPLINFNENLAWSHTVTTSRRFTWYELVLKEGDSLTYVKDGVEKPITTETFQIEVSMDGMPEPLVLERTFYFSEYGPMIAANAVSNQLPGWGDNGALNNSSLVAHTYRDANANTGGLLDTWLKMSRASNLDEFQSVFQNCGSTLWTNTTYADDQGNAFYIDSSSVPNLSEKAIALVNFRRAGSAAYAGLFDQGVTLLDGRLSQEDWVETECGPLVPYDQKPMLVRSDWVQNSNSSYWSTNPDEFLTGFSPLFGDEKAPINPRTRLGIKMLQNPIDAGFPSAPLPAGQDGKFSAEELIGVIWNNRAWYAEQFLPELQQRCDAIGSNAVNGVDLSSWCSALNSWDGLYNRDSVGAHIFRVFMANYRDDLSTDLTTPFSPADPVGTPADPTQDNAGTASDTMLLALADGVSALQAEGILPTDALGDIQYYRASGGVVPGSGGIPSFQTDPIPWHGGDGNIDGAFNAIGVVTDAFAEDTRFPRIAPTTIPNTAGLSDSSAVIEGAEAGIDGWLMARGTSWHFGLEFTDTGPEAYGLVSYSQSTDSDSPFFSDQSLRYSNKDYRQLLFTEEEIQANLLPQGETVISSD